MNRNIFLAITAVALLIGLATAVYAGEQQESICIACSGHSEFYWGADLIFYSDESTTQKMQIDGATGNVDGEGTLDIAGATSLGSTLGVTGDTTLAGALAVAGTTSLAGINYDVDTSKVTTNTSVLDADSGTLFLNMGATTEVTLTLPSAVTGTHYCFYVSDAYTMTIDPDDADQVHHLTNSAGDRLQNTGTAGDSVCLAAVDATYWVPLQEIGTWSDAN